ncbi:MAG: hypothetical protein ACRDHG_04425 [Anaerolineales bacterium]
MILTSSLLLILGSCLQWLLRRRAARAARFVPIGAAAAALSVALLAGSGTSTHSIWRPAELFGPGFQFELDERSRPFLLLACLIILITTLRRGEGSEPLLLAGSGFGIAAALASDPLSLAFCWVLMSTCEAALELSRGAEPANLIRRLSPHAGGALLLIALEAAPLGTVPVLQGVLAGAAIVLRTSFLGNSGSAPITGFALLNPIVALAAGGRLLNDLTWFAVMAVSGLLWVIGWLRSLPATSRPTLPVLRSVLGRLPLHDMGNLTGNLRRGSVMMARWLRSGTELLEGQSAVLWMFLALLAVVVAIRGGPG